MTMGEGTFEVHLDKPDGLLVGTIKASGADWKTANAAIGKSISGRHDLFVIAKSASALAVDWIKFE